MAAGRAPRPLFRFGIGAVFRYDDSMEKQNVVHTGSAGLWWCAGWLFTIGYLKLSFWPGALALIIWPYHIGVAIAALHH